MLTVMNGENTKFIPYKEFMVFGIGKILGFYEI